MINTNMLYLQRLQKYWIVNIVNIYIYIYKHEHLSTWTGAYIDRETDIDKMKH